jgi:hypothetical protein
MAMIHHFHGVAEAHARNGRPSAASATSNLAPASPYLRGFSDDVLIPVSRWTEMKQAEIDAVPGLTTLLGSAEVGPCLVEDAAHRALYIFNHLEYDSTTLKEEYDRDVAAGAPIDVPVNYYPGDDPVAACRRIAGAAMRICSTATGSTRSTRPRPTTWSGSGAADTAGDEPVLPSSGDGRRAGVCNLHKNYNPLPINENHFSVNPNATFPMCARGRQKRRVSPSPGIAGQTASC